jgi:hypothetical protein
LVNNLHLDAKVISAQALINHLYGTYARH